MSKLMSPIKIGKMEVRNRISMPAMHLNYEYGGEVSDKLINFYAERAKGGAGLIIIGGCAIDKRGGGPIFIGIDDDRFLPGLTRFTEEIHKHGAKTCAQLYQAGAYSFSFVIGQQSAAPSAIPSKFTKETPKELTKDEIAEVVRAFGAGADRAKRACFDAVEILGSAGYLICQFLSPLTNHRTDEYGGILENRMRFPREVIREVRRAVGPDFPVIIRVAGNDFVRGSNANKEIAVFCKMYEEEGVDAIDVTGGWHETKVPQLTTFVPRGGFVYLASGIKKAVKIPVISSNRINDPELAEKILQEGLSDMINLGRALICDPYFPAKVANGKTGEIRRCIACNQGCFDQVFQGGAVGCMLNPRAGKEGEIELKPADVRKKVLVIGGGAAGMEAARMSAERGHEVTLIEKERKLGGQLPLCAAIEERKEFGNLQQYLEGEIKRLGVKVKTGRKATVKVVEKLAPDALVVATGAKPLTINIPGVKLPLVKQSWDVLLGKADLGENVAIIGGGAVGCEVALCIGKIGTITGDTLKFLLENDAEDIETLKNLVLRGTKNVTIIEMLPKIGADIGRSTRWTVLQELHRRGIKVIVDAKAKEIVKEGIVIEKTGGEELVKADTVVMAVGSKSENSLYEEVKDKVKECYIVGDAVKPRKIMEAMNEAFFTALKI